MNFARSSSEGLHWTLPRCFNELSNHFNNIAVEARSGLAPNYVTTRYVVTYINIYSLRAVDPVDTTALLFPREQTTAQSQV